MSFDFSVLSQKELVIAIMVSLVIAILSILFAITAVARSARLAKRYRSLVRGEQGANLEELLQRNHAQVDALQRQLVEIQSQLGNHDRRIATKITSAAIKRYNAFGESGNDLSFSLSLIDEDGAGAVLSSIFGRDESRVYAKPVANGTSTYTLTEEEKSVIRFAKEGKNL